MMKEATGELSMTTITIIAVIAIAGIVAFLAPMVKNFINQSWNNLTKTSTTYVDVIMSEVEMQKYFKRHCDGYI